jgi:glycosyltransferase involved in cell wall biosynthesis
MNLTASEQEKLESHLPAISIVIPLLNEADNIFPLYHDLKRTLEECGRAWEVIFVDDGSTDQTFHNLTKLHHSDAHIRVIRLRRNFGQSAALMAGFDHARGEVVVALDGDLQNDPKDIPLLLQKLDEGYDVVSGWRVHRQENFWRRRLPSQVANWLISKTTGTYLHDYGCTLKAYRAEVIKEVRLYGEMHRFLPALLAGGGARIAEIPVHHRPRLYGKSKYGISRTIRVLFDLLTVKFFLSFLTKPLQIFGLIGLVTSLLGFILGIHLVCLKFWWGESIGQRPLLSLAVLLMVVGVQFICMGILAEIQIRAYHESSHKPLYAVWQLLDMHSPLG